MRIITIFIILNFLIIGSAFAKKEEQKFQLKAGVVYIDGKPKYYDPTINNPDIEEYLDVRPDLYLSDEYTKNITNDIIKGGVLFWLQDNILYVNDLTKRGNLFCRDTSHELKLVYKVTNQVLYVSKDATNWEPVTFRMVNDKVRYFKLGKKGRGVIYMTIYLKSAWFKGDYDIYGTADKEEVK